MGEEKITPVQVKLPIEMNQYFEDIREERIKNCEPTSNISIVIDAVKDYHKKRVQK